ncbi:NUDIX domain-containing protein [Longispora albida]|uniref:NUDIX domain-containing protein n=1 Tax=Longispora albida TaxID=203523 RepID=UPI000363415E|nr:NUDIX domain-containing protein [Longispora albida]
MDQQQPAAAALVPSPVASLVASIVPSDGTEAAHRRQALEWIASGAELYRTAKPATPPIHLVSYFQVIDPATGLMLLGEHRSAGLLLPNGGHVEPGETPWETVTRECHEELRTSAVPSAEHGTAPVFVSVTATRGIGTHTDVSLWHIVHASRAAVTYYDPDEFTAMRWLSPGQILDTPITRLDPCMHRFVRKMTGTNTR